MTEKLPLRRFLSTVPDRWLSVFCIVIIAALGIGLRIYLLGEKALWWDEAWSMYLARKSALQIILESAGTQHPPFHYLYLHYWIKLFGESEYAGRLTSTIFGVATLPVVYLLGARIGGRATGFVAALFLAVSPFHIHWSQEIRMYTAATFFGAVSLLLFLHLSAKPSWPIWLGYVVATSAMLYLHYGTAVLAVVEALVFVVGFLAKDRNWRRLGVWIASQVAIVATLVPWLLLYLGHTKERQSLPTLTPVEFLSLIMALLPLDISAYLDRYIWIAVGFTVFVVLGATAIIASRRGARLETKLLPIVVLVFVPGLIYLMSLPNAGPYSPRIEDRYFLVILPVYAVTLAAGLVFLARRALPLAAVGVIFIAIMLSNQLGGYYAERHMTYDLAALGQFLNTYVQSGDAVVVNPDTDWPVYAYYLGPNIPLFQVPYGEKMNPERAAFWLKKPSEAPTIWLIEPREVSGTDTFGAVRANLSEKYATVGKFDYRDSHLTVFSHRPPTEVFQAKATATADSRPVGSLQVLDSGLGPRRVKVGDSIYGSEFWKAGDGAAVSDARLVLQSERGSDTFRSTIKALAPTREASPNHNILSQQRLGVPYSAYPGEYAVSVEILQQGNLIGTLPLGKVSVVGASDKTQDVANRVSLDIQLDSGMHLDAMSPLEPTLRPGAVLPVVLYWSTDQIQDKSYSVFVHVIDDQSRIVAQHDGVPANGKEPTTSWEPGNPVADPHEIPLPDSLTPGKYRITVGLYDSFTGNRVQAAPAHKDRISEHGIFVGDFNIAK